MTIPFRRHADPAKGIMSRDSICPDTPRTGAAKMARIDLGLALMRCYSVPGTAYTQSEIAAWCGCSSEAIRQIEDRAIRKLRRLMASVHDPVMAELVQEAVHSRQRGSHVQVVGQ